MGLRQRVCHLGWRPLRRHIRTAVTGNYFSERKTAWMDVWGLIPEKVGSHGTMTSAFWGGGVPFVWKSPWWGWSGPCPYAKYTLAFSLQLRKIAGSLGFVDLFFYSWGSQIESRPRQRLSWLRSRYFPQSLEDKAGTVLYLYENRQLRIYKYVRSHYSSPKCFGHSCDHHHGVTQ